ncbi:hypothetical protein JTE90_023707 [Oedothorax gibbosus]|uniref:C2H2-type domain-containing protein n=1 Tax=Oedothorax gibbosus TaxID=931172 RepID=A0AAV6TNI2_9ARAC|nr:hypothetical protein JTE90_023707 [Oedothorax gibbosus]
MKSSLLYGRYNTLICRKKDRRVTCPFSCSGGDPMSFGDFWRVHMKKVHQVNASQACPFCLGKFQWLRQEARSEEVNRHRLECMKALFPDLFHWAKEPKVPKMPKNYDTASGPCSACYSVLDSSLSSEGLNRPRVKRWGSFYREVGEYPPFLMGPFPAIHVSFSETSGLGDVMWPIVQAFLAKTYTWYHVSLRAAVWKEFEMYILSKKGVYVLPYWALCDGAKNRHAHPLSSIRHHRHMIMVTEKWVSLEGDWKARLKIPNTPQGAKLKIRILNIEHLINALFYVSQPHAKCDGYADRMRDDKSGSSHYYLNRPLYPHAKLAMHMLFSGGLQFYVDKRSKQRSTRRWFKDVRGKGNSSFVKVSRLGIPLEGCVLPWSAEWEFSHMMRITEKNRPDAPYVWLYQKDQVMVLRSCPALKDMPYSDWYVHQMNRRNCFLNSIQDEEYVLGKRHLMVVNDMRWLKQEMKSEFEEEKRQQRWFPMDYEYVDPFELREREWERERSQLLAENKQLRHDLECEALSESELKDQIRNRYWIVTQ